MNDNIVFVYSVLDADCGLCFSEDDAFGRTEIFQEYIRFFMFSIKYISLSRSWMSSVNRLNTFKNQAIDNSLSAQ